MRTILPTLSVLGLLVLLLASAPEASAHSPYQRSWFSTSSMVERRYHEKGGIYFDYGVGWRGFGAPTGAWASLKPEVALRLTLAGTSTGSSASS